MSEKSESKNPHKVVHAATIEAPASVITAESKLLFDKVVAEVLHSERGLFDSLSLHEQNLVIQWLAEAVVTGQTDNSLHDVLWELDYIRKPVSIEQFIEDDLYLGRVGSNLHPRWKADLKTVFTPGSPIFEWVMTGAIGVGKTTLAMISMAYCLYRLSCLRDPATYYGLLPESMIAFGIFSITKRQVADTGYNKLRGYIDVSPYFRQEFPRNTKIDSVIDFLPTTKKAIKVVAGSQDLHALGLDVFAYAMDEVNFMRAKRDKETGITAGQAYDIYNAVYARILSRFMRPGGVIPGIMVLMSSRKAHSSFLEEHLKKVKDNPHTYISDYRLWDVKEAGKFGKKTFRVEVGDRLSQSRLLSDADKPRPGAKVVEVPNALLKPFQEDVDQALRDLAGVATFNVSPLVRDRQSVYDAVRDTVPNPMKTDIVSVSTEGDDYIEDFFDTATVCRIVNGRWRPKLNPHAPRFIHLDLALRGDAAGFAMGHVSGLVESEKMRPDGLITKSSEPFIVLDLVFRIIPPLSGEIDLSKIRAFIFFLKKLYPVQRVTADGFQSADTIQILNKQHRTEAPKKGAVSSPVNRDRFAGLLSVDRSPEPYLSVRSALFDRRIAYYKYGVLLRELLDLERDPDTEKIDHPERASDGTKGSKDSSDAVAGVVWDIMTSDIATAHAQLMVPGIDAVSMRRPGDPDDRDREAEEDHRVIGGKHVSWAELQRNADGLKG